LTGGGFLEYDIPLDSGLAGFDDDPQLANDSVLALFTRMVEEVILNEP